VTEDDGVNADGTEFGHVIGFGVQRLLTLN
jgi:hypothetical protein